MRSLRVVRFISRKHNGGCQGLRGVLFNGDRVSVLRDERVLEMDVSAGHKTL